MNSPSIFLSLMLALTACGGPSFQGFDGDGPSDGLAGAGGDVDPGTGGSAGGPPGGAGGTGASGSGGGTSGGAAGGPTEPSCAPEEALVFPESFNWNGFSARWDDVDRSYCASSAGGVCTFRNAEVQYLTAPTRVDFMANLDCSLAQPLAGVCGEESACDTVVDPGTPGAARFFIDPQGDGYRLRAEGAGSFGTFRESDNCHHVVDETSGRTWAPGNEPTIDFRADFQLFIAAQYYPCP